MTITHTGVGTWQGPKKFELRSTESVYPSFDGATAKARRFEVVHHRIEAGERATGTRRFLTEADRTDWLDAELPFVDMVELADPIGVTRTTKLERLNGLALRSVTHDQHKITLLFDTGLSVQVHGTLAVFTGLQTAQPARSEAATDVVRVLGQTVRGADELSDYGLWIPFEDGSAFSVTRGLVGDEDEVASLHGLKRSTVWTANDPVFNL